MTSLTRRSLMGRAAAGGCAALVPAAFAGPSRAVQSLAIDMFVPFAPTPVVVEGRSHTVYELHITNMGQLTLTLQQLDVADHATGQVWRSWSGADLNGMLARPGTTGLADPASIGLASIGPGLRAVAFIDIVGDTAAAPSQVLSHRLVFAPISLPNAGAVQTDVSGGVVQLNAARPVVLGPPLSGDGWLASHGLSNTSSHRRSLLTLDGQASIAQRFAIDWTRIGADGQIFRGDPASNANWTPYGSEVLAVADGRVVGLLDGLAENDPTADNKAVPITFDTAPGNHLVLDIGDGRFVLYAHLKPGGLKVGAGDRVVRGQVLAALGNSGKSDAPHLHFQVMNGPAPLASEGLPFVFERFTLQGHVASLAAFVDGTGWRATEAASMRRHEIPLENAVISF